MKNSRFILILVGIAFIFFSSGCTRDPGHSFEMDLFHNIDIPAGLNTIESHFFIIEDIDTRFDEILATTKYNVEDITGIYAGRGRFSTRLSGIDLNFINGIGIHVLDKSVEPYSRKEAFYIDFIPIKSKTEIDILPSIVELSEYLINPNIDIELRIDFRTFIPEEIDARIDMNFLVFTDDE